VVEFRGLKIRDMTRETESGLRIVDIAEGTGDVAEGGNTVTVHYIGQLLTGAVFDDSYQRGEPVTVPIDRVILGWREGIRGMQVGGRRRLIVPPELAYGEAGVGDVIPPDATLVFDVELIAVSPIIADAETNNADEAAPETSEVTESPVEEQDDTNTETQDTSAAPTATPISSRLTITPTREASQSRQMDDPLDVPNLFEDEAAAQPESSDATEPPALPAPTTPANEPQPLPVIEQPASPAIEPRPLPTTNSAAPIAPASSQSGASLSGPSLGGPRF
jgi:hypothetical protein